MKYSIEVVDNITVAKIYATAELSDIKDAIDEAAKLDHTGLRLWDLHEGIDLTRDDVKQIADYGKSRLLAPSKAAFFVVDDLAFGLARMVELYNPQERTNTMVFRSKEEALSWLNAS